MKSIVLFFCVALLFAGNAVADKFKVDFYAEALCPYCRRYVASVLKPLFENGLFKGMELTIYYAGNAKLVGGRLKCQHGAAECYLNKVLGCAIARGKDVDQWFPFVECLEQDARSAVSDSSIIRTCASKAKLNYDDLMTCAEGKEGKDIQMKAYEKTKALDPPHRWVPWVVMNGVPMYDLAYSLGKILCIAIPEEDRPKDCDHGAEENSMDYSMFRSYPESLTYPST